MSELVDLSGAVSRVDELWRPKVVADVLEHAVGVAGFHIGHGVGAALLADEQAVALGEVAGPDGVPVGGHQAAIGVGRTARRDAL